jgi:hypothetical protein
VSKKSQPLVFKTYCLSDDKTIKVWNTIHPNTRVAALPDRSIPISKAFLPVENEKAARVMTRMVNRVSSVAVDFVRA